ncbi:MAG: hypothetical protein D6753_12460 [Planctomycetota bacterium]|nr:MAG: hypothetical protein D6753_12460 [Planctomycetota bacterium]
MSSPDGLGPHQPLSDADIPPLPDVADDVWTTPGDLARESPANPYQSPLEIPPPTAQASARQSSSSRGLSLGAVFQLAFERLFPNCLLSSLIYFAMNALGMGIGYGGIFLVALVAGSMQVSPDMLPWVLFPATAFFGLLTLAAVCGGVTMVANGALATMRASDKAGAEHLTSIRGYGSMLAFLLVVVLGMIVLAAVAGLFSRLLGGAAEPAVPLLLGVLYLLYLVALSFLSLTPIAIADGHDLLSALSRSLSIVASHPVTVLAALVCSVLLTAFFSAVSCGFGGIVLGAFPMYVLAAIYRLAD